MYTGEAKMTKQRKRLTRICQGYGSVYCQICNKMFRINITQLRGPGNNPEITASLVTEECCGKKAKKQ